jgi:hypothetical protein
MSRKLFLMIVNGVRVHDDYFSTRPDATGKLLSINEERGFLGMIGSIDCMHWEWKNCTFAWQ